MKISIQLISITIAFFIVLVFLFYSPVQAAYYKADCCPDPIVNRRCVNLQLSNEADQDCAELYCTYIDSLYSNECSGELADSLVTGEKIDTQEDLQKLFDVNFFGIKLRFDSDRAIQQLLVVGFTGFLGAATIAAVLIGLRAAVQRALAEGDESKIEESTKMIRNSIVGFTLMIVSLIIVQLVGVFLGVGNIFTIATTDRILPNVSDTAP